MNIHIDTLGHGPDLVLLHGWGLDSGVFEPLCAPLARRYRLHLVDLPGYGRSREIVVPETVDDLVAALVKATPIGASWLGWSLGAQLSLLAARRAPGHIGRLVLVAATPCFVAREGWPCAMAPDTFRAFADGLRQDWRGTLTRFIGLMAADPRSDREQLRELRARLLARGEPTGEALARGLNWLRENDLRGGLPAVTAPVLWLQGERDRLVPPAAAAGIAGWRPRDRVRVIAGAGHAPFLSRPGEFLDELASFLAEAA
jgi:pimeloyl-[acyl-carrier protein] methyl ester esterase